MKRVYVTGLGFTPGALTSGEDDPNHEHWREFIDDLPYASAKGWRRMSWSSRFAYVALGIANEAATAAGPEIDGSRVGLVVGSRYGCLSLFEDFQAALRDEGPKGVSPTVFTTGVLNAPAGHASLGQGLRGPCHTLVGSQAAGLEAIALAWELLQSGAADRVFAVGVEEAPQILTDALRVGSALPSHRRVTEGAVALALEAAPAGGVATIGAIAAGRCGRSHHAVEAHAALIRAAAGAAAPTEVVHPGAQGADGDRERAAVRLALPVSAETTAIGPTLYAPGFTTAFAAHEAAQRSAEGSPVIATAAGGAGTTVAIRFDPVATSS